MSTRSFPRGMLLVLAVLCGLVLMLATVGCGHESALTTEARQGLVLASRDLLAISAYLVSDEFDPFSAQGQEELREMESQLDKIHETVIGDEVYFSDWDAMDAEEQLAVAATEHAAATLAVVGALVNNEAPKEKSDRMARSSEPYSDEYQEYTTAHQ